MLASSVCFLLDCKTFICQPLTTMSQTPQLSLACCHQKQHHSIPGAIQSPALRTVTLRMESGWMDGCTEGIYLCDLPKNINGRGVVCSARWERLLGGPWGAERGLVGGEGRWNATGAQGDGAPRKAAQCSAGAERGSGRPTPGHAAPAHVSNPLKAGRPRCLQSPARSVSGY